MRARAFFPRLRSIVLPLFAALAAGHAHAQEQAEASGVDLFGPEAVSATADLRLTGSGGEVAWLDGGLGKARLGGTANSNDFHVRPRAVEGDLIWQPRLGWALGGTFVAVAQHGQEHFVDLSEAFLSWKPLSGGRIRVSGRAGLMWPPVSLEHSGPEWAVTDTITPSAINSWIGEEVKLLGVEGSASADLGGHQLALTASLFGFNDTSGTLLAFRGWALHDEKATAFGMQPLPPLYGMMLGAQAPLTRPVVEIDGRPGWYVKLGWTPPVPLRVEALHYDNRGDPEAVDSERQWGWRTKFDHVALIAAPPGWEIKAQAMQGWTAMGFPRNGVRWVHSDFRAGYVLVRRKFRRGSISGRIEAFGTRSEGSVINEIDSEDGWALTGAVRRKFGRHVTLFAELLHVESRRDARLKLGLAPRQSQTVAQLAVRLRI